MVNMDLRDIVRLCIVLGCQEGKLRETIMQGSSVIGIYSVTDVDLAINEVERSKPFDHVYDHAVALCGGVISECVFETNELAIGFKGLERFSLLGRWISFDLMMILACTEQLPGLPRDSLPKWGLHPRFGSRHLRDMLSQGVGDMHMHEMALRQAEDLWRRLVQREVSWSRVNLRTDLFNPWPQLPTRERFIEKLEDAIAYRHNLIGRRSYADRSMSPAEFRATERRLIFDMARRMKYGRIDLASQKLDQREERNYVLTKNTLWRLVRQPEGMTPPGLYAFSKRWYPAIPKSDQESYRETRYRRHRAGYPPKQALLRDLAIPFRIMAETPALRRVEVRVTPPKRVAEYRRMIDAHGDIFGDRYGWCFGSKQDGSNNNSELIATRIGVHFRRVAPLCAQDLKVSMINFDREGSALLKFRAENQDLASAIARLDMAGAEREMSCRVCGFVFRFLRSDCTKRPHRKFVDEFSPYLSRLDELTLAKHRLLPRLGATCHAGEDFPCQLVGLREIADALHSLNLRDGDSIGHALALGWDPQAFFLRHGNKSRIRYGEYFDSLLWAFLELGIDDVEVRWRAELEGELSSLIKRIYEDVADGQATDFWWQFRFAQVRFPWIDSTRVNERIADLVSKEYLDEEVFSRRQETLSQKQVERYPRLLGLIEIMRQRLLSRVANRGVVIEINPSSNMRIGGATDPREMPALNILEDERLMSTIGTDDPGVFGTNIEYEYALIEDALIKKNGWPRHQAVALLNRARRASIYGIYWPDYRGAYCEN